MRRHITERVRLARLKMKERTVKEIEETTHKNQMKEQKQYQRARQEHAFLLRCEGLTFREIASHMGVTKERARALTMIFARQFNWAKRHARIEMRQ